MVYWEDENFSILLNAKTCERKVNAVRKQRTGKLSVLFATIFVIAFTGFLWAADHHEGGLTPDQAFQNLKSGNERFSEGKRTYPHQDAARVQEVVKGQHPFVTIISCSDSRVPVEILFDVGVGDIFSVRVAGNVCDTDEIGSIEYGVGHLGTPILVVLGHTACGAVTAVVKHAEIGGNIPKLVDNIIPAVEKVKKERPDLKDDAFVNEAVKANVWQGIEDILLHSEEVCELVEEKKLRIIGAIYHLDTSKVEWLGSHYREKELIEEAKKTSENVEEKRHEKTEEVEKVEKKVIDKTAEKSPTKVTTIKTDEKSAKTSGTSVKKTATNASGKTNASVAKNSTKNTTTKSAAKKTAGKKTTTKKPAAKTTKTNSVKTNVKK